MRSLLVVAATALALLPPLFAQAPRHNWPQYLGPTRNGVAASQIPPTATLTLAWKKPMPSGGAGIVIDDGRAYTLGSEDEQDVLFAFDVSTGREDWRLPLGATHPDATFGPNATAALAGDLLIVVPTNCQMKAVNLRTQEIAWTVDLGAAFTSRFAQRGGCGMSPLLAGDRLVIHTGAADGPRLAALDAATGKTLWTADVPPAFGTASGYAPGGDGTILYHHVKEPEASGITAVSASTGAVAWQIDGEHGASGTVPVALGPGRILLERWPHSTLYDVGSRKALWTTREMAALDNPAIHREGHFYGFGGQSAEFMVCIDAATGQLKWSSRIYRGHLVLAGDTLVVLSSASGLLRLVAADPMAYRERARLQILTPGVRTQTPPSLADGRIFARNLEEIVAVAVR